MRYIGIATLCCLLVVACHSAMIREPCTDAASCREWAISIGTTWLGPAVGDEVLKFVNSRETDGNGEWLHDTINDVHDKWCPHNSYYELIPVHMASIPLSGKSNWQASCFGSMTATLTIKPSGQGATVVLTGSNQTKPGICEDLYVLSTSFANYWVSMSSTKPSHMVDIPKFVSEELMDLKANGLAVLLLPCGILGTAESVIKTLLLFDGPDLGGENRKFLLERKVYPAFVPYGKQQIIPASIIKSGAYLAITRMDGLDPMVMWGTGGRTGHSAVAVWDHTVNPAVLYVLESTAPNPFGKIYWPPPYGVIKHKYEDWIDLAIKAEYQVNLLQLSPDVQAKFNETSFWAWYNKVEGQPYGFHSFIYSVLDTYPMRNLPQPIDGPMYTWFLTGLDRLLPNDSSDTTIYSIFTEGLNHRLGVDCDSIACISKLLLSKGMTIAEASALPELDTWIYDGKNLSMVCSVFAHRAWQNGFGSYWPEMQGTEQTPKDNYQLAIFDANFWNEQNCPLGLDSDPTGNGKWCQLMGSHRMPLNGFNTIPIYPQMNSKCPAQWPDYFRCPADNPRCC